MFRGNNCIVIFYESFTTTYSYTRLGKTDDVNGLKDALSGENTTVELCARLFLGSVIKIIFAD